MIETAMIRFINGERIVVEETGLFFAGGSLLDGVGGT